MSAKKRSAPKPSAPKPSSPQPPASGLPGQALTAPDPDAPQVELEPAAEPAPEVTPSPPHPLTPSPAPAPITGLEHRPDPAAQPEPAFVSLDVPAAALTPGQAAYLGEASAAAEGKSYVVRHVDVQLKDVRHRAALQRLLNALDGGHFRLANGKLVQTAADAIRWILKQYAAALEAGD